MVTVAKSEAAWFRYAIARLEIRAAERSLKAATHEMIEARTEIHEQTLNSTHEANEIERAEAYVQSTEKIALA